MKSRKQKAILAAKIVGVLFVLSIGTFFIFRNSILQKAIAKVSDKMEHDYDSNFSIKKASFQGFSGISLENVLLVPKHADTLLNVESIQTNINFWKLLTGDVQLGTLHVKNGFVKLVKDENGRNFDAFLKRKSNEDTTNIETNYAKRAYRLLNQALNLVPTDMNLENVSLRMDDMGRKVNLDLKKLRLKDKQLETSIGVTADNFQQHWKIKGFADPRRKKTDLRFFNLDTGKIRIPYIDERFNMKAGFDSIRLNVSNIEMDGGELHIDGFTSIVNFTVNHPKIANKDVVIKQAKFDYNLLFGEDFVAVDSTSSVTLNKMKFSPYVFYQKTKEDKNQIYALKVKIPKMKAQDFIVSLPEGLFTNFEGMEAEGNFSYDLDFLYNKNKPGELVFDSKLNKENLKITKYGEANLSKLNGNFAYRAIINGVRQRQIEVGMSNPNYTPLDQISPYIRKAVLTSEDPSFFSHRGFINEAFKQSIIKNIKTKRFSRGASTISMQLIKNVFLTREKTLSRKLEEILLVYILENNRIASKERMLEVYFNIIEWGPNVYGIGEAAYFYFGKHPSQLNLNESLFLASIVPRPRGFMWQFDNQGKLKSFAEKRNEYMTNLMIRRGLLTQDDTLQKHFPVEITGPARSFLRIKAPDSTAVDTIAIDEEFDF
ncbi:transglycosylase domain-containing protein [Flavobacterium lindanitolerans]|uniref:Transglycosylase n=1 Tax=Flavobacterium lindanitolerans TaxID=428988 RepID=A0A497VGB2_9FLAO|nr:biosynthetic peptidoglycan transglycosylase [Flavobacterium lindanitolerans]PKW28733.1 transglycosylase [Flavobacterium lindanitolerans]RLJ35763.1 transglycosylase [Flavobacterium lindanitolerans]